MRSLRLVLILLVISLLLPLAGGVPRAVAADRDGDFGLDLSGTYRFSTGDDPAWKEPGFDDSAWAQVQAPDTSFNQGFDNYDGFAWFRREFTLPAEAEGVNLIASMGFIDDADEVYLNGVLIGASGTLTAPLKAAWYERRLYTVPADLPNYGGVNTLAVRMRDYSGGGGWYKGPIGFFSKSRLRAEVYGITAPLAPADVAVAVESLLAAQSDAIAAGDLDTYAATLDPTFFHDGQDLDRRLRELGRLAADVDEVRVVDGEVEVLVEDDGTILVDTNRALVGLRDGVASTLRPSRQEFLRIDPSTMLEMGNRSRFFRDELRSTAEARRREFNVYLPPSYLTEPDREFPVVYLLHGINGGNREWEPREIDGRIDDILAEYDLAETIVVMPDGESLWYRNGSTRWRDMFVDELVPLVDAEYRTLAQREFRSLTGISMGGNGAFSIAWDHPELFSSIGSHIGALTLGGNGQSAANYPAARATGLSAEFLSRFSYFFDSCAQDDFGFAGGVVAMRAQLTAKLVPHEAQLYPVGRHNDDCWLPNLWRSFEVHSDHYRANGLDG
jgi:enterochelin esterase-like enzyme